MSLVSYQEGAWIHPVVKHTLRYRIWRPAAPRVLLVVVHGFGEHGGRYGSFAEALAQQGLCVVIPDLWGHGRSDGRRGDLEDVGQSARDLQALVEEALLPQSQQEAYVVFGHSFGGLVAIHWALNNPSALRGMALQSPLLEVGFPIPRWKTTAATLLTRWWPTFALSIDLETKMLSHDPAVVEAYRADPLVHNIMTARAYRAIMRARDEALARAQELRGPVLLLCGGADRIISVEMAQRWFDRLVCEKRLAVFPECYHELHHEPIRDEVLRMIRELTLTRDRVP